MANFVNLILGTREALINKDFIVKVDFYSHDTEQNVLVIIFAHNVEFPFYPESERECKQMKFFFSKPKDALEDIGIHSKLSLFAMELNKKETSTIYLEDFFLPRNESPKESQ